VFIDTQSILPKGWFPTPLVDFRNWYLDTTNDPLVGGELGVWGNSETFLWFRSFLYLELCVGIRNTPYRLD
jgi:hypothetical protein